MLIEFLWRKGKPDINPEALNPDLPLEETAKLTQFEQILQGLAFDAAQKGTDPSSVEDILVAEARAIQRLSWLQ